MDKTDILVLGAGLAGFSAALAAREAAPAADITMVSLSTDPHGSSFANPHNQLGIQVCLTPDEKRDFINEAISIASPGEIHPGLTAVLARESRDAFERLKTWGAEFQMDKDRRPMRVKGCFSKSPRAYIIRDMAQLFHRLKSRAEERGIHFQGGWEVRDIQIPHFEFPHERYRVELISEPSPKNTDCLMSHTLILALGGQAGTLSPALSGAGTAPSFLPAWCEKNGIARINDAFTQFVWCRSRDMGDWQIYALSQPGGVFKDIHGNIRGIPVSLHPLFKERASHAPISWGRPDRALDDILIKNLDHTGRVDVFTPSRGWEKVMPAAQVSNGGILVDNRAGTKFRGFFACGECAGGMHGANRIGGAMVLSCMVFGHRAGKGAARLVSPSN